MNDHLNISPLAISRILCLGKNKILATGLLSTNSDFMKPLPQAKHS